MNSITNVWLTRPARQADDLEKKLQALGISTFHLPMLEITSLENNGQWQHQVKNKILDLDQYQLVFFISTNAARYGMSCINNYWPQYPLQLLNFAVGPTTAAVLESYDLKVLYPQQQMTSEGLLALPELANVVNQKALIVRGLGGRELLAKGLEAKGVRVDSVELYRRSMPSYESKYLMACITNNLPECIIISSAEALENLTTLFQTIYPDLFKCLLLVSSQRIKELALTLGYQQIIIMPGANDEAILTTLEKLT